MQHHVAVTNKVCHGGANGKAPIVAMTYLSWVFFAHMQHSTMLHLCAACKGPAVSIALVERLTAACSGVGVCRVWLQGLLLHPC